MGQQTIGSCLVKPHCEARRLPRAALSPIFTWVRRLSRAERQKDTWVRSVRRGGQEESETHLEKVLQLLPPSATEKARLVQAAKVVRRRKESGDILAKVWKSFSSPESLSGSAFPLSPDSLLLSTTKATSAWTSRLWIRRGQRFHSKPSNVGWRPTSRMI